MPGSAPNNTARAINAVFCFWAEVRGGLVGRHAGESDPAVPTGRGCPGSWDHTSRSAVHPSKSRNERGWSACGALRFFRNAVQEGWGRKNPRPSGGRRGMARLTFIDNFAYDSGRLSGSPNGTRTRVFAVRGQYPRPLDDGTTGYDLRYFSLPVKHFLDGG